MKYTDDVMIGMLTNSCPNEFREIVEYVKQQLATQLYYFVIRRGGRQVHIDEIFYYAMYIAHVYAAKNRFNEKTNVLAFIFSIAKKQFSKLIADENKLPKTSIEEMNDDLKDILADIEIDEEPSDKTKVVLKVLEKLNQADTAFLMDALVSGMGMEEIAKKYKLKNAQIARNKKCKIIRKIRKNLGN